MAKGTGDFIWYELTTPDPLAAAGFYEAVLGWRQRPVENPAMPYHLFSMAGVDVSGAMTLTADMAACGARPGWLAYIGVADTDAAAAALIADGARQIVPPTDIPGVGRFALLTDPQGAPFYIMRGGSEGGSTAFAPNLAGHCQWNELSSTDPVAALGFYSRHFGWQKSTAMPMGEAGTYQLVSHGGGDIGAVMPQLQPGAPSSWLFYFGVADIDTAEASLKARGAAILHGPSEVPGQIFIIVATDPQGAVFGVVGPRATTT